VSAKSLDIMPGMVSPVIDHRQRSPFGVHVVKMRPTNHRVVTLTTS
jgi:hypothetical protein